MVDKKRILMIIPNLDFGGAQTSLSRITLLLNPFCIITIVVFNRDNIAPLLFGGELMDLNVPASRFYFSKTFNFIKRISRLKKIKKKFNPHISISFLEGADYVNLLSSQGEKIFFYLHGSKLHDKNIVGLLGFLRRKILIPLFYARANKLLVVNERIAEELRIHFRLTKSEFKVLPNFYDFVEIRRRAIEPLSDALENFFHEHRVICISGRISPEKGIDRFVRLSPNLFNTHKAAKIAIVGSGPQSELIKSILNEVGVTYQEITEGSAENITASVLFMGYQTNPYKFLIKSSLLVLPSLNEGMPNTIVEAMCLGVPVIAADCPYGPRELLSTQKIKTSLPEYAAYGILMPILNSQLVYSDWIEGIDKLLTDASLKKKYSDAGLTRSEEFSQERMIGKWQELLSS
jgi:N-acetylgalactosamine-N,N'-diacetylbacillosaminyl-diphospho-undecaprenol 4-alpha-N-acetylgalactosaminyltransferase